MREQIGHGVRRMCVACDLEHYSRRPDNGQIEAQRAMARLLSEAGERGALERAQWLTQPQGDGELALLPPGVDEARVITGLWRELRDGLHRYNRYASTPARLRMRIAVHEGQTYIADNGFAGDAINTVCRLRDCAEIKNALSASDGDLVLIVSDRIFYDVIRGFDAHDLPASGFAEATVIMPDKDFRTTAFIFGGLASPAPPKETMPPETASPKEIVPSMETAPRKEPASPKKTRPDEADGAQISFTGRTKIRNFAARDINNHYGHRDE
jgi:hypothetical protein